VFNLKEEKTLKRPIVSYIILSNIIFLPLFAICGVIKLLGLPSIVFDIFLCIASWSSTYAFAILFKRIYSGQKFTEFVKDKFKTKLKFEVIIAAISIQILIFGVILFILLSKNSTGESIFTISSSGLLIYNFFFNLFAGPLGEELGWRGFALNELQKKHSPLISAIIVGFWWACWHIPLWFTFGFVGVDLIKYIVFFIVCVISVTIMMTAFYNLNKNLLITIIIHQLFNFLIGIINGELLDKFMYCAIVYCVVAVILIVVNPKKVLYRGKDDVLEVITNQ
jgi:membrane protease YdiL (CAAX protease family)